MYSSMRLKLRECKDETAIQQFLERAETGFLGLSADDSPYVVPLNFVWHEKAVYFHGASEGRKADYMRRNGQGCFTVSQSYGTLTSPVPAHIDTAYMSVMLFGRLSTVDTLEESTAVMQAMIDKYMPGFYNQPLAASHLDKYRSSLGSRTVIYKLTVESISAKSNAVQEELLFRPGMTLQGHKAK
ncbi:pyridoxamine 5'-phosphate oxidase [Paenibacillus sp. CCS19]|uniref:pyridoxamine 5'-phosphate oxidase family protein n=1 Tax=Paenibacillus sp. CCS19 TaxID=3158387 RepID=UPI0025678B4E|nr:pyridoxamine 5'-phosphate oxidase family protein [Paenibacillus cellulosilyticus]GMK40348.1 pyridoxamine 5'-phosphate oxidase [Paenibacillus cellulosilyticus]